MLETKNVTDDVHITQSCSRTDEPCIACCLLAGAAFRCAIETSRSGSHTGAGQPRVMNSLLDLLGCHRSRRVPPANRLLSCHKRSDCESTKFGSDLRCIQPTLLLGCCCSSASAKRGGHGGCGVAAAAAGWLRPAGERSVDTSSLHARRVAAATVRVFTDRPRLLCAVCSSATTGSAAATALQRFSNTNALTPQLADTNKLLKLCNDFIPQPYNQVTSLSTVLHHLTSPHLTSLHLTLYTPLQAAH